MTKAHTQRPAGVHLLLALLLLQGLPAVFGGLTLVVDPGGGALQMPLSELDGTPFSDYLIPGLILLLVLGVFPLLTVAALWFRPAVTWLSGIERFIGLDAAWLAGFAVGVALLIWLVVQLPMIGFASPSQ